MLAAAGEISAPLEADAPLDRHDAHLWNHLPNLSEAWESAQMQAMGHAVNAASMAIKLFRPPAGVQPDLLIGKSPAGPHGCAAGG
jgi:hypothetical protein